MLTGIYGIGMGHEARLGWSDAFLIVAISTLLAFSLVFQLSPQPYAVLDAALDAVRETVQPLAARALEALRDLPAILQ